MVEGNRRGAIIFAGAMKDKTIMSHFSPNEEGTLLEYVMDSVWTVADELNVVFESEPKLELIEAMSPFGAKFLAASKGNPPMKAICGAFESSQAEHCILVSERVPLLKPNVALTLFENARGFDLAIPRWKDGRIEPMLAVYRKKAILRLVSSMKTPFTDNLEHDLKSLIDQLFDVKFVSVEDELREVDPELDSFLFVTDEKSLTTARSKATAGFSGKTQTR
jgi:molybdenum cofactor guanylyltransferase